MKKALVTMCFGEGFKRMSELTHPTIKAYADKVSADFIVIDKKKISNKYFHYEKFQLFDILAQYHRVLFMDSDLIIRPDCPNLFDIVPEHQLAAFNEGRFFDMLEVFRDACMKFNISLPKWERQGYNTGVMVLSRLHRHIFEKPEKEFDVYAGNIAHYEQPYINLKIISDNYPVHDLNYKFNRMSLMDRLTGENRRSSYVIHYASAVDVDIRMNLIKEDLKSWGETAPDYYYPRNIHFDVGGGLGDQIDAEPVIRYACKNLFEGDNVRVKTDFPRVFSHLPVRCIADERAEFRKDKITYFRMETLPSPETPLWRYLAQTLCHTIDFCSISALRRTLPDKDKEIKMEVGIKETESLMKILGDRDPRRFVLVHPGKGWPSKTFPSTFWQGVINQLDVEGHEVVVIGKYVSEEQGLVDIECEGNILDLRNMLSLDELIALISKARVLISNDSAPIHIAGAFDNWIILIPSCKHPDHVLPYRQGTKSHKSTALYKKLTTDAIDSSPTQVDGQTIDYVKGDIMEYLPDITKITENVKYMFETDT